MSPEVLASFRETHRYPCVTIESSIPQVSALILIATNGDPEAQTLVAERSRQYDSSYLAWELVRKQRAGMADSVGQVFSDGRILPHTGFEGYFSGLKPEEIVAEEAELGTTIIKSMGNFVNCDDNYTLWKMNQILSGRMHGEGIITAVRYFDEVFAATLARARAISANDSESFRRETYAQLLKEHNISYKLGPDGIYQTITLPTVSLGQTDVPRVELRDCHVKGYLTLAEIGRFGHPLTRSALDFHRQNRFLTTPSAF